jgi:light-regulated signal transduction histidine kinase (bacteriophytochrome)
MRGESRGESRGENKQQRFARVVEKRVQNVLDSIRRLSQCSNRRMYEWNDEQLTKIWDAIDTEFQNCKESYKTTEPEEFRL